MTKKASMSCVFGCALLLIGAACGGSDGDASESRPDAVDSVENDAASDAKTPDAGAGTADSNTAPGFGELMEGSFGLTGATEVQYTVGDDQLAFQTSGGCQGGEYGFGVHVIDAAGTTTFATFAVGGKEDLSGGVTGEFADADFEATVVPGGDLSLGESFRGPVKMVISEHDTGGADADLNARRMTVTLLGSVPADTGTVDVDITYRWVMGCP